MLRNLRASLVSFFEIFACLHAPAQAGVDRLALLFYDASFREQNEGSAGHCAPGKDASYPWHGGQAMIVRTLRALLLSALLYLTIGAPLAHATVVPPQPTNPTPQPTAPEPTVGDPPVVKETPEPATMISAIIGASAAGFYAWRRRRSAE